MRDSTATSAASVARVSFLIDLSALQAPLAEVQRGVTEIASVGLGVTWGVGGEGQARLAAEAGAAGGSDAAVVSNGSGTADRRRDAQLAGALSLEAVVCSVDPTAPSVRLRLAAAGLWECTPNRLWSPERRSLWNKAGRAHLFRATDTRGLAGASVVVVAGEAALEANTRLRLIDDLRAVAAIAEDGGVVVLPVGGLIQEHAEATTGRPQRSILRAA
ncbi:MAG: hypothetical protein AAGA92_02630 [Planctomycetota bacterium]